MSMKSEVVRITPMMAKKWLEAHNNNNRNLRQTLAQKYARDMDTGHWDLTHQGIAFYQDGTLADGQHRLQAIVICGKTIPMMITRNLPNKTAQAIDQNAPREMHDVIQIAGGPDWVTKDTVALARTVMCRFANKSTFTQATPTEIMDFVVKYAEPLQFVAGLHPRKKRYLTPSILTANYFCAIVAGESRQKISRFAEIMITGEIAGQHENAAIRLREFLMSTPSAWGSTERLDSAKKAQRALKSFLKDQPLQRLYSPEEFIYPIPT